VCQAGDLFAQEIYGSAGSETRRDNSGIYVSHTDPANPMSSSNSVGVSYL